MKDTEKGIVNAILCCFFLPETLYKGIIMQLGITGKILYAT
jgi:hypothetical protein